MPRCECKLQLPSSTSCLQLAWEPTSHWLSIFTHSPKPQLRFLAPSHWELLALSRSSSSSTGQQHLTQMVTSFWTRLPSPSWSPWAPNLQLALPYSCDLLTQNSTLAGTTCTSSEASKLSYLASFSQPHDFKQQLTTQRCISSSDLSPEGIYLSVMLRWLPDGQMRMSHLSFLKRSTPDLSFSSWEMPVFSMH